MGAGSKCLKHSDFGKETSGAQTSSFTPESPSHLSGPVILPSQKRAESPTL